MKINVVKLLVHLKFSVVGARFRQKKKTGVELEATPKPQPLELR